MRCQRGVEDAASYTASVGPHSKCGRGENGGIANAALPDREGILGSKKRHGGSTVPWFLSFPDKFFPAFGAGDGDLALAPGHPDGLVALGAIKMLVLAVLHPVQ